MKRTLICLSIAALAFASACKKKDEDKKKEKPTGKPAVTKPVMKVKTMPAPPKRTGPVARGAYLVKAAGCVLCHTPFKGMGLDMDKAWSGGFTMKEEFGTWTSPNITPDKETGIGSWTDEQIIASIREGVRPDKSKLYPIMPYPFYRVLSDEDAKAIVAFLRTLKPIKAKRERNKLKMGHVPVPKPTGKALADKGAYFSMLMKCAMCHTPMDKKGAPIMAMANAGGFPFSMPPAFGTGVIYSPNITPDMETGIGKWTPEQLVAAIKFMKRPNNGKPIMPPMAMYAQGWSQLDDADVRAVAEHILKHKPIKNKVPANTFKPAAGMGPPPKKAAPKEEAPKKGK